MFAINAESLRWGDVRGEEVGEGESRKPSVGINIVNPMTLALLPSDQRTGTESLAQPYEASIIYHHCLLTFRLETFRTQWCSDNCFRNKIMLSTPSNRSFDCVTID